MNARTWLLFAGIKRSEPCRTPTGLNQFFLCSSRLLYSPSTPKLSSRLRLSLSLSSLLGHVRPAIRLDLIMSTPKDRGEGYKSVPLDEQDAVELRKAVATGSVKEPLFSSASA